MPSLRNATPAITRRAIAARSSTTNAVSARSNTRRTAGCRSTSETLAERDGLLDQLAAGRHFLAELFVHGVAGGDERVLVGFVHLDPRALQLGEKVGIEL